LIDEFRRLGLGYLALKEDEWGEMRLGTFFLKVYYFFEKRKEDRKFYGEILRLSTLHFLNTQLSESTRINDPKKIYKFSWEEDIKVEISEETAKENIGRMIETLNKVGNGTVKS
jgi:hypothetical protein